MKAVNYFGRFFLISLHRFAFGLHQLEAIFSHFFLYADHLFLDKASLFRIQKLLTVPSYLTFASEVAWSKRVTDVIAYVAALDETVRYFES